MNIVNISENSVIIIFEQVISHQNFSVIKNIVHAVKHEMSDVVVDMIPSYASIHITFNLLKISGSEFKSKLESLEKSHQFEKTNEGEEKVIEIPVYYGEEVALDLPFIAERAGLTESEVIEAHSSEIYDVYAIGFSPGFAYLGNVDERIATPRKETPRQKVVKGSLGIADQQTAIYPADSPGGWQIIGRTTVQLIDYESENLTHFAAGDKVKFIPMTKEEYVQMGGAF